MSEAKAVTPYFDAKHYGSLADEVQFQSEAIGSAAQCLIRLGCEKKRTEEDLRKAGDSLWKARRELLRYVYQSLGRPYPHADDKEPADAR